MTEEPRRPKTNWVDVIKSNIKQSDEYREAVAYRKGVDTGIDYFNAFLKALEYRAEYEGIKPDPKAFENAVREYPNLIAGPVIAQIMASAAIARSNIKTSGERQYQELARQIDMIHARSMEIMETHIMEVYTRMIEKQEERLARLREIEDEQDINFMRAVTLWEEREQYKHVPTWSPIQQYRNIRNIFRRSALEREAMEAMQASQAHRKNRVAEHIEAAHDDSTQDLEELKVAFQAARNKIAQLDYGDMSIFDCRLQSEVNNRTHEFLMARFKVLYPPNPHQ